MGCYDNDRIPNPEFILTAWVISLPPRRIPAMMTPSLIFISTSFCPVTKESLSMKKFHGFDAPIHKAIKGFHIGLHAVADSPDILHNLLGRNLLRIDDAVQMKVIQKFPKIDMIQLCDNLFLHTVMT